MSKKINQLDQATPQVVTTKLNQDKINNPNKQDIHPAKKVATLGAIKTPTTKQPRTLVEWIDAAQCSITIMWVGKKQATE